MSRYFWRMRLRLRFKDPFLVISRNVYGQVEVI